jgi:hypothetical protein
MEGFLERKKAERRGGRRRRGGRTGGGRYRQARSRLPAGETGDAAAAKATGPTFLSVRSNGTELRLSNPLTVTIPLLPAFECADCRRKFKGHRSACEARAGLEKLGIIKAGPRQSVRLEACVEAAISADEARKGCLVMKRRVLGRVWRSEGRARRGRSAVAKGVNEGRRLDEAGRSEVAASEQEASVVHGTLAFSRWRLQGRTDLQSRRGRGRCTSSARDERGVRPRSAPVVRGGSQQVSRRTSLRPWSTLAVITFILGKRSQTFFMPSGLAICVRPFRRRSATPRTA